MKPLIYTSAFLLFAIFSFTKCTPPTQLIEQPSEYLYLRFENQKDGINSSAVAFHLGFKTYYTVIAGNKAFPLEVFNSNGDFILSTEAEVDCRGLWYNPKTKCLETNSTDGIIYCIHLGDDGLPTGDTEVIVDNPELKKHNTCANFDSKNNFLLYYSNGQIFKYKRDKENFVKIHDLNLPCEAYKINKTNFIYTGYKEFEIGLLNCEDREVYFFNLKTGETTHTIKLPDTLKVNCEYRFDFVNDFMFFYDLETRMWTGLKIF
ncbi:MAG: hypothetical protein GX879_03010 [Bacteroidales bacterium]|nr:hypothetical protein [Bacteroidales bacterium]